MEKSTHKTTSPFADVRVRGNQVRATLIHDPLVVETDIALYLDGSASMSDEFSRPIKEPSLLSWFLGKEPDEMESEVESSVRSMLKYLASKDRNGILRLAYFAAKTGEEIELIGNLSASEFEEVDLAGPSCFGVSTQLHPAIRDYVDYAREQATLGAKRGCAVFVTDGFIQDVPQVKLQTRLLADRIAAGDLVHINFILMGVGDGVSKQQFEDICSEDYGSLGSVWSYCIADELNQLSEIMLGVVDASMSVASGGTIFDDQGNVVKVYLGRLPAVLDFNMPQNASGFTLEVYGQRFTYLMPGADRDSTCERSSDSAFWK